MLDAFLFGALPYVAVFVLVAGSIHRYRQDAFSYTAQSSQFLEGRALRWGSLPWHLGILLVLLGHLPAFLTPVLWRNLMAVPGFLFTVEVIGLAAACLALFGLAVLLVRRILSAEVQATTQASDLIVLALLLVQVGAGIAIQTQYRWGAVWSTGTTTPYLWSLLKLQPDYLLVSDMPALIKIHLTGAWLLVLMVPFSRLVHVFSVPLSYLFRPPQRVLWTNPRRLPGLSVGMELDQDRRHFLKAMLGLGGASLLLSLGGLDKLARFFRKQDLAREDEMRLLSEKVERLHQTAEERQYRLERLRSEYIPVARLSELSPEKGKYFIDYQMRPALAFLDAGGLPLLISAKCTHLGCTVSNQLDAQGRLLCPCHVSYFDLKTGQPNPGAPAKTPLPHLGWVLLDEAGQVVVSRAPGGAIEGGWDRARSAGYRVCIARKFAAGEVAG